MPGGSVPDAYVERAGGREPPFEHVEPTAEAVGGSGPDHDAPPSREVVSASESEFAGPLPALPDDHVTARRR